MRRIVWTLILLLILAATPGCGKRPTGIGLPSENPGSPVAPRPRASQSTDPFSGVEESIIVGSGAAFDARGLAAIGVDSITPNPVAPGDDGGPSTGSADAAVRREVIYEANLEIAVLSAAQANTTVQRLAESVGGHLQESDSSSITIRVPSAQFESTLDSIARLGAVNERAISASDVTEEMIDLEIRLDNARRLRARLNEHLEKSRKITDTLAIEKALARVSETIETIEGQLRYKRSQVAMSTINVAWEMATGDAMTTSRPALPFPWIESLGDGLVAGAVAASTRSPRWFDCGPRFEAPPDFIRYYSSRTNVEAMNADGVRIKLRRHPNLDRGPLAFWRNLARERLIEARGLTFTEERALADDRMLLRGTREVDGRTYGYLLLLKRTKRHVLTFEAWGPQAAFERVSGALEESAATIGR